MNCIDYTDMDHICSEVSEYPAMSPTIRVFYAVTPHVEYGHIEYDIDLLDFQVMGAKVWLRHDLAYDVTPRDDCYDMFEKDAMVWFERQLKGGHFRERVEAACMTDWRIENLDPRMPAYRLGRT